MGIEWAALWLLLFTRVIESESSGTSLSFLPFIIYSPFVQFNSFRHPTTTETTVTDRVQTLYVKQDGSAWAVLCRPHYLFEVEGTKLGLLAKLPLALGVGVVQLARQLFWVAKLLDGARLVGQTYGLGWAAEQEKKKTKQLKKSRQEVEVEKVCNRFYKTAELIMRAWNAADGRT